MKKIISIILAISILTFTLSGYADNGDFTKLNDPMLPGYLESALYENLVSDIDSEQYIVEKVSVVYISQEYLEELDYNSQTNVFFGYTLAELDAQFGGTRYVFTLGENNQTVVQPFESYVTDTLYLRDIIKNVAIGAGVILVCVVISSTAFASAPAISAIFAAGAKGATIGALTGTVTSALPAGIATYLETGSMDEALKSAAITGSEGFKWGAVTGAVTGSLSEGIALHSATANGLSMNQVAIIQRESHYPLDVIKGFKSMDQYEICKNAGLTPKIVNGKTALIRNIDLDFTDEFGRTNLQRMQSGLAALDPATGKAYQLHHIGQNMDSTLAILTEAEHMQNGNNLIWHVVGEPSTIDRNVFDKQRAAVWQDLAKILSGGN